MNIELEQKAMERARKPFPCSCGLDELFEHAGKNNRLDHAATCPAHMRHPVAAALLDFHKEGLWRRSNDHSFTEVVGTPND